VTRKISLQDQDEHGVRLWM